MGRVREKCGFFVQMGFEGTPVMWCLYSFPPREFVRDMNTRQICSEAHLIFF